MIYYTITIVDMLSGIFALVCLLNLGKRYTLTRWIAAYTFLSVVAVLYGVVVCLYNLSEPARDWRLPIFFFLVNGKTIFLCWGIRFSLLRRK